MATQRYFLDERVGCIAVRDRTQTDPWPDTLGVVWYQGGELVHHQCPTCGRHRNSGCEMKPGARKRAQAECDRLNGAEI